MGLQDDPASAHVVEKLTAIFPSCCGVSVLSTQTASIDKLPAEEASAIDRAAPKRQREFAAGRAAARLALEKIGRTSRAISVNADRSPQWPQEIVGSITHSGDLAAAVVALRSDVRGLGIDLEQTAAVKTDLWDSLFLPEEIADLKRFSTDEEQRSWATVLFSAKESFFKLQHPITGAWLDFQGARITLHPESCAFELELRNDQIRERLGQALFAGKFAIAGDFTLTGLWLRP